MDTTESEKILTKSTNVEENAQPTNDSEQEIIANNDFDGKDEGKLKKYEENVCEELVEENPVIEIVSAKEKEPIEILNVELVTPRKDIDTIKNEVMGNDNMVIDEYVPVIENSGTNVEEIAAPSQPNNENSSDDNEMEALDENSLLTQAENKCNIDEAIANDLEPLGSTVTGSLSLLAQYQSDDDTDSVIEVPTTSGKDYRNQVVEIDSNSDSDDSSDSSGVECLNELRKTIEKRIDVVDEDEEDEDDNEENTGKKRRQQKLRVKGEMLLEDLPPIHELQITVPEEECIEFGKIHSVVDQLILVSALPNSILLDLETVIFLDKGQKVMGVVFDVLGQVADPLYCVRFNSNKEIKEKKINIGDVVYVAPKTQYTQYVILSNLMGLKGSDASWENDVEPPPRFLDYSDDEQEQLARRKLRNKDKPNDNEDPSKRPRTVGVEDDSTSSNTHRKHYNEQRNSRGGPAGYSNVNNRPRYNGPPHNQQRAPNYHRGSWHSNYYPQTPSPHPTGSYGMRSALNQPQSSQPYPSHQHIYAMPPTHNIPYPPTQPTQYGAQPPMYHQHPPQLMPNAYSIRPPTLHPPIHHVPQQYQYSSPPPPGSQ